MSIKKELLIYLILFIISSGFFHYISWTTIPFEHLKALFSHSMPYHPFLYTFIIYVLVGIFRIIISFIKKLIIRK